MQLKLVGADVDLERRTVTRAGATASLSPIEARLMAYLAARPGEVLTQDRLLQEVWAYRPGVHSRTVVTTIERLRRKVELDPTRPVHVVTDGKGYRFARPLGPTGVPQGRVALVERALAAIERGTPLLTLVGPGGIGKSYLARVIGTAAEGRRIGHLAVELEGVRHAEEGLQRIAAALEASSSAVAVVRRALAHRAPLVLWLDDLDAFVPAAAELAPLLGAPGVTVLATCREPLGSPHEEVLRVELLSSADTTALLHELAPGATLAPETLAAMASATQGLPLAIRLMAGWLALLPSDAVVLRAARLPAIHPDGLPDRHRSLAACMARTWESLTEADQLALSRVCAVPGPLPLAAFEAVVGPALAMEALPRLQRRSCWSIDDAGRVRVLVAIREFVVGNTPPRVAAEAFDRIWAWGRAEAHREYQREVSPESQTDPASPYPHTALLWELADRAPPGPDRAWMMADLAGRAVDSLLDPGRQEARLAAAFADADADPVLVARLRMVRARLLLYSGGDPVPDLLAARDGAGDRALSARAAVSLGMVLRIRGRVREAAAELEPWFEAQDVPIEQMRALFEAANGDVLLSKFEVAKDRLMRAEVLARRHGKRRMQMMIAARMGGVLGHIGTPLEAETVSRRALAMAEQLGVERDIALNRNTLALHLVYDRVEEASRLVLQALARHRRTGDERGESAALSVLGIVQMASGRFDRALATFSEALQIHRELHVHHGQCVALVRISGLHHRAGHAAQALAALDEAAALTRESAHLGALIAARSAVAAADLGDRDRALALRAQAEAGFSADDPEDRQILAWVDGALAGDLDAARARICTPAFEILFD